MRGHARWPWAALMLLALAISSPVVAQEAPSAAPASPRDKARDLAERGQDLLLSGNAAQALPLLVEADETFHAPTIVLLRGRAEAALGRFDEAYASFTRILDEPFDDTAPTEFAQAREIAAIERSKVAAGHVRVDVSAYPKGTTVTVDGVARAPGLTLYLVAPGPRRLNFVMPDGQAHEEIVKGSAGDSVSSSPPAPAWTPPPVVPPPTSDDLTRVPAWIGFGLGAAGVGVGTAFGVLALNEQSALEEACPTFSCDPEDRVLAEDAGLYADVSTAGFIVGGVGAAFGVVWLIVAVATDEPVAPRIGIGPGGSSLEVAF